LRLGFQLGSTVGLRMSVGVVAKPNPALVKESYLSESRAEQPQSVDALIEEVKRLQAS